MNLCEYGCGQEYKVILKNGKLCCSNHYTQCPAIKKKMSGNSNPFYGKKHNQNTKKIISEKNKLNTGHEPWNKNLKNCFDEKTIQKMSESHKGLNTWSKGKKLSIETRSKMSLSRLGIKNSFWKGGYDKKGVPSYDTYAKYLTIEEKPERYINDKNILTVICAYSGCNKRFIPSLKAVWERSRSLRGTQLGEQRLYCSEECKTKCSIYRKSSNPNAYIKKNENIYTYQEYQDFRVFVLERDHYSCQYCGNLAEEVHHERPQKLEPFFALDPDLAWSVCKKCHNRYGHIDGCSTNTLAQIVCKDK
jgi:hypothetical protein